jgi:hypothetical protein
MTRKQQLFWLVFTLTAVTLLTACGGAVDQSVTFYKNEAWEAETKLSLPGELVAFGGAAEVERQVEDQARQWRAQGANVSWKSSRDGTTLIYTFDLRGQGLNVLNATVFNGEAAIQVQQSGNKRHIHFSRQVSRGLFDELTRYTLALHGGEVISGNGRQLNRGSMEWINPSGRMEAVLTEKGRLNFTALLLPGLALGVVAGGWLIFRRRPGPCPHCGQWLEAGARFCPACGQSRSGKSPSNDPWTSDKFNEWN